MPSLLLIAAVDPDGAAWARWLQDVMTSWPAQLAILLLYVGLAVLLVRHASREWENGARNRYLLGFLTVAGALVVLQFLLGSFASGRRTVADRPLPGRVRSCCSRSGCTRSCAS